MATCLHCKRSQGRLYRGLCTPCNGDLTVRVLYGINGGKNREPDFTTEQLDAIEAEQRPTLPPECHEPTLFVGFDIPPVMVRGRGLRSRSRRDNW